MTESMEKVMTSQLSSKKENLSPKPEIEETELPPSSKIKTSNPSSKVKLSVKKQEVVIREDAVEVIETLSGEALSNETPSKKSFKPVSDYVKTPFSKIKENDEDAGTPIKQPLSCDKKDNIQQPDFEEEKTLPDQVDDIELPSDGNNETEPAEITIGKIKSDDECGKKSAGASNSHLDVTAIEEDAIDAS
jgi:hypothetical protein